MQSQNDFNLSTQVPCTTTCLRIVCFKGVSRILRTCHRSNLQSELRCHAAKTQPILCPQMGTFSRQVLPTNTDRHSFSPFGSLLRLIGAFLHFTKLPSRVTLATPGCIRSLFSSLIEQLDTVSFLLVIKVLNRKRLQLRNMSPPAYDTKHEKGWAQELRVEPKSQIAKK